MTLHRKVMVCLGMILCARSVYSESLPRSLVTDARVKLLVYSASEVYKLVAAQ